MWCHCTTFEPYQKRSATAIKMATGKMATVEQVKKVAEANADGFTFDIRAERMVTSGIVAAYAATQDTFGFERLAYVVEHAANNGGVVGGWLNRDNARFYFDSCRVFTDLAEAMAFGKAEGQIAIFDLDQMKEVRL